MKSKSIQGGDKKRKRNRKGKKGWRAGKTSTRDMGERERIRQEIRDEEFQRVEDNLDYLGDPYDQMDLHTKKQHALAMYYKLLKVRGNNSSENQI